MSFRVFVMFYLISLLLPQIGRAQGRDADFVLSKGDLIEDLLFSYYDQYSFNGGVLVAQNEEIIYENTFGFADIPARVPLDGETPFYLASLSKQFTATGIMKLLEEGEISLNESIKDYFPRLPDFYTQVKISHLLNHTSGIPDYLNANELVGPFSNEAVYKYLQDQQLLFTPGSKYRYSNSGYVLLAMIIESVSGESIQNYYTEVFFEPLKMKNTFVSTRETKNGKRALGFDVKGKPDDYNLLTIGDGGFYSTTTDLYAWLAALNNGEIISEGSLEKMYTPTKLASGREKRYGFGWELGFNKAGSLVYHTGQLAGFRTFLEYQKSTGTCIIILSNNSFNKMSELRNMLVKILDGRLTSISDY